MNILKKYWYIIILAIALILLDIYLKQLFYTIFLVYGLFIKLISSKLVVGKLKTILSVIIWTAFLVVMGLTFYVNYYLPHGPSYPTGDIVCQNNDRGPCGEAHKEDMRLLNIPDWAKFLREYFEGVLLALLVAGIAISNENKNLEE